MPQTEKGCIVVDRKLKFKKKKKLPEFYDNLKKIFQGNTSCQTEIKFFVI